MYAYTDANITITKAYTYHTNNKTIHIYIYIYIRDAYTDANIYKTRGSIQELRHINYDKDSQHTSYASTDAGITRTTEAVACVCSSVDCTIARMISASSLSSPSSRTHACMHATMQLHPNTQVKKLRAASVAAWCRSTGLCLHCVRYCQFRS